MLKVITELAPIRKVAPVDEHFDVVADLALIVEHVAAYGWPRLEVALEELGHRARGERGRRAFRVPCEVLGEMNVRHGRATYAAERASTS